MILSSNTNSHIDYYERSLYDEFTLKHQQQQQQHINHSRGVSMDGASRTAQPSSHPRFNSSSPSSNNYLNNGGSGYRQYPHLTPSTNTFHQLQTPPCFNEISAAHHSNLHSVQVVITTMAKHHIISVEVVTAIADLLSL